MKVVMVEWKDANSRLPGWEPIIEAAQIDLPLVRSVGWLIGEHDDRIVICLDIQDLDCNQASVIPRNWITNMKELA